MAEAETTPNLRVEVLDKMIGFITAAFGLVAALAWNSAIQAVFTQYFPPGSGLGPMFLYAVLVTVLAIILIVYVGRAAARAKERVARPLRRTG